MQGKTFVRHTLIRMTKISIKEYWKDQDPVTMQGNWNAHTLLVQMQNISAALEKNLAVFYKVQHILTIWPKQSHLKGFTVKKCTSVFIELYS